jgi:hypothetical protein
MRKGTSSSVEAVVDLNLGVGADVDAAVDLDGGALVVEVDDIRIFRIVEVSHIKIA